MTTTTAPHAGERPLTPAQRQDLTVLLRLLEGWLLVAEPATIHELDAYLRSEGLTATASQVLDGLNQCQRWL